MRPRDSRPVRAPLPVCLRHLHPLRPTPQHRRRHPLRPRTDGDGALPALWRLPRGIRRPGRPAIPRRGDGLPRLRAPPAPCPARRAGRCVRPLLDGGRRRCRRDLASQGRDRRDQGAGRLSACLRRHQPGRAGAATRRQTAPHQAFRPDGARPRRPAPLLRPRRGRARRAAEPGRAHRADAGERDGAPARGGGTRPRDRRHHAADDAAARAGAAPRRPAGGDDQRQRFGRPADHRRRGPRTPCRRRRVRAGARPAHRDARRRFRGACRGRPDARAAPRPRFRPGADRSCRRDLRAYPIFSRWAAS